MRTMKNMRTPGLVAGVLILATPASAAALAATQTGPQANGTDASSPHIDAVRRHVGYGQQVVVRGQVPPSAAGRPLTLQYETAGRRQWRTVSTTTAGANGRFVLGTRLRRSGQLRVAEAGAQAGATGAGDTAAVAPSRPEAVQVAARLRLRARRSDTALGRVVTFRGTLLPGTSGRRVRLITHAGHSWRTLATGRTGRRGGFTLRYRVSATGTRWLRVGFGGDSSNRGISAQAGNVTGMVYTVASWYYDAGQTACGFHAGYGVASKSLPCGTRVTFSYGGRSVVAVVDDRGPYVAGRTYDLNQNTAATLGVHGVQTVLASR
jgi:rare lipoprotein A